MNAIIAYAIYAQAISATAFIIEYQRYTHGSWRRRVVGWHLMMMTGADALFAIELAIAHLWPSLVSVAAFRWSIAIVFAVSALIVLSRLVILEAAQRWNLDPDQPPSRRKGPDEPQGT